MLDKEEQYDDDHDWCYPEERQRQIEKMIDDANFDFEIAFDATRTIPGVKSLSIFTQATLAVSYMHFGLLEQES